MGLAAIADLAFSEGLELIILAGPELRGEESLRLARAQLPPERPTRWHYLPEDGPELWQALTATPGAVVLAHGLEYLPTVERQAMMDRMNLLRDPLVGQRGWLVLFVPRWHLEEFQRRCADLHHWRSLLVAADPTEVPLDRDEEIRRRRLVRELDWHYAALRPYGPAPVDPQVVTEDGAALSLRAWAEGVSARGAAWQWPSPATNSGRPCGMLSDERGGSEASASGERDERPSPAYTLLRILQMHVELRDRTTVLQDLLVADYGGSTRRFLGRELAPPQSGEFLTLSFDEGFNELRPARWQAVVIVVAPRWAGWYRRELQIRCWAIESAVLLWSPPSA